MTEYQTMINMLKANKRPFLIENKPNHGFMYIKVLNYQLSMSFKFNQNGKLIAARGGQ